MRKLTLAKEHLAELSTAELGSVGAAIGVTQYPCISGIRPCFPTQWDCDTMVGCLAGT